MCMGKWYRIFWYKQAFVFPRKIYIKRRKTLREKVGKGLILLFGNRESPMIYVDNTYHFRQDSSFLYYFGIQRLSLAALINVEKDLEITY